MLPMAAGAAALDEKISEGLIPIVQAITGNTILELNWNGPPCQVNCKVLDGAKVVTYAAFVRNHQIDLSTLLQTLQTNTSLRKFSIRKQQGFFAPNSNLFKSLIAFIRNHPNLEKISFRKAPFPCNDMQYGMMSAEDEAQMEALADALRAAPALRTLKMRQCYITPKKLAILESKLAGHRVLQHLDLSDNPLGEEGGAYVVTLLGGLHLNSLRVAKCNLGRGLVRILEELQHYKTVAKFDASENILALPQIDPALHQTLGNALEIALRYHPLRELILAKNNLDTLALSGLARGLASNHSLTRLVLSDNTLYGGELAVALLLNHSLEGLDIAHCTLLPESELQLAGALQVSHPLQSLNADRASCSSLLSGRAWRQHNISKKALAVATQNNPALAKALGKPMTPELAPADQKGDAIYLAPQIPFIKEKVLPFLGNLLQVQVVLQSEHQRVTGWNDSQLKTQCLTAITKTQQKIDAQAKRLSQTMAILPRDNYLPKKMEQIVRKCRANVRNILLQEFVENDAITTGRTYLTWLGRGLLNLLMSIPIVGQLLVRPIVRAASACYNEKFCTHATVSSSFFWRELGYGKGYFLSMKTRRELVGEFALKMTEEPDPDDDEIVTDYTLYRLSAGCR